MPLRAHTLLLEVLVLLCLLSLPPTTPFLPFRDGGPKDAIFLPKSLSLSLIC